MKQLFTIMAAALVLFTSACKKDESKKDDTKESGWTFDGTKYTVKYSVRSETSTGSTLFIFWDAVPTGNDVKFNTFNLDFKEIPTTSGTYQLVGVGATPTAKQFTLFGGYGSIAEAGEPTGDSYGYAYIGDAVDVTVTVEGGKVKVSLPEVSVHSTKPGTTTGKVSASIKEL